MKLEILAEMISISEAAISRKEKPTMKTPSVKKGDAEKLANWAMVSSHGSKSKAVSALKAFLKKSGKLSDDHREKLEAAIEIVNG